MAQQVRWGNATLILDHNRLHQGYQNGRRYYFEDWPPEGLPTGQITVSDLLHLVAIPDEQGHYQLEDGRDITAFRQGVEELVGVLIGYLGGPLYPETPEEQGKRRASCMTTHEAVPVR
jgi:hypothetical protein